MRLYDFQSDVLCDIKRHFVRHNMACLAWYTGAGKTNVFAQWCRDLIDESPDNYIGISAYLTREIRDQVSERLELFGLKEQTWVAQTRSNPKPEQRITVFNPQGLYWRKDDLPKKFTHLIIDEGHVGMENDCLMLNKIIKKYCTKKTKILLVSATPWDTLMQERFKDVKLFKRPLDQGMKDGLITDFTFRAEEASITFEAKDFSRVGDLTPNAVTRQLAILRSACIGKLNYLINNYNKELGKKVLVICPPGNLAETARALAEEFKGLAFIMDQRSGIDHAIDTTNNLEKFKTDDTRFLFVVNKCSVGFDMKELSSVVDLTMTRNIKTLAQRFGRVARANGSAKKTYFYVYDKSLMKDKLQWIISTSIDFCLGAYDGWTTRTAKYRRAYVASSWMRRQPYSINISEVVKVIQESVENKETVCFVDKRPPTRRTLKDAIAEAEQYASRTDMWRENPGLYKWFRLNAKNKMDEMFPYRFEFNGYNEKRVISIMKKCSSRVEFNRKYKSAADWVLRNKRGDLREKYLPPSRTGACTWTEARAEQIVLSLESWKQLRKDFGTLRVWLSTKGLTSKYRKLWEDANKKEVKAGRPKNSIVQVIHLVRDKERRKQILTEAKKFQRENYIYEGPSLTPLLDQARERRKVKRQKNVG